MSKNQHINLNSSQLYSSNQQSHTVFVFRSTDQMSMAQGLFKVDLGVGPQPTRARHFEKYLGPRQHSPEEVSLRRQAINLTPPKRVKACWDASLRPEGSPVLWHTRPELRN